MGNNNDPAIYITEMYDTPFIVQDDPKSPSVSFPQELERGHTYPVILVHIYITLQGNKFLTYKAKTL